MLLCALLLPAAAAAHPTGFTQVDVSFPSHDLAKIEVGIDLRAVPRHGPLRKLIHGKDPHADPVAATALVRGISAYLEASRPLRLDDQPVPLRQVAGRLLAPMARMAPVGGAPGHDGSRPTEASRVVYFRFEVSIPSEAAWLSWQAPEGLGKTALTLRGDPPYTMWLRGGQLGDPLPVRTPPPPPSALRVTLWFVAQGFTHIVPGGLDHVLFVLGLFLLAARIRPLLWQVSLFTGAHCITLALSTLGTVSLPAHIVEPLITASIVYVAVENLFTDRVTRWRGLLVFAFGLIHGLGFASALGGLQSLTGSSLLLALLGFNIGVELGQLAVLAVAFGLVGWCARRSWFRARVAVPLAVIIAATGLVWTVQRLLEG